MSQDAVKRIKSEVPIASIAQQIGLDMIPKREHFEAACPVCQETGSRHLYLYPDNRFHCFKCQSSGDQIDLYRLTYNCTLKTAIEGVKTLYGYTDQPQDAKTPKTVSYERLNAYPPPPPPKPAFDLKQEWIQEIYSELWFHILNLTDQGREYLLRRGLTEQIVQKYDLRSIDEPDTVSKALLDSFPVGDLLRVGLFTEVNGEAKPSLYKPGIVFPHFHPDIYLEGFVLRCYEGEPRFLKLPGVPSPVFQSWIDKNARRAFVFEGIINALSFELLTGEDNFLALSGLISPEKYRALRKQYPDINLVLAMDPDAAGQKALDKIASCDYLNWDYFARELGLEAMPTHPNGKKYDANDLLLHLRGKEYV